MQTFLWVESEVFIAHSFDKKAEVAVQYFELFKPCPTVAHVDRFFEFLRR